MPDKTIELTTSELQAIARYAAACAQDVLGVFEADHPADSRPRDAITAASTFADSGQRTKSLRDKAFAANAAAREATIPAARDAARAAGHAAAAAYLHPLANANQVKHILGAAAHAAHAAELDAGDEPSAGARQLERARRRATPTVTDVLMRYPAAPPGGGRVGELLRELDAGLRAGDDGLVRLASVDDVAAIERITSDAYAPYVARIGRKPAPMTTDYHSSITTTDNVRVLVVGDAVVGVLITAVHSDHLVVENVAVASVAQGRGYGRHLLGHAEHLARADGLTELRLYTNAAMTENLALYPRLGYVEVDRRMQDGFDRVFFVKTLDR